MAGQRWQHAGLVCLPRALNLQTTLAPAVRMLYFETGCLFLGDCKTYALLHTAASTSTVCSSQLTRCWLHSPAFLDTRQLDQTQVL